MNRRLLAVLVSAPAVVCALIGLTHPMHLDAATATYWRTMHIVLIPIFPLLGFAPWLIARQSTRWLALLAAIFGYGFATFYTSLDLLAGVAAGAEVVAGVSGGTGPVFAIARVLGAIGVGCLVLGCITASISAFRVGGVRTLPGTLLAIVGAALVQPGHIYAGLGTAAMLLLAGGFVILVLTTTQRATPPPGHRE